MADRDPVHEEAGLWFFWNETWSDRIGPFSTQHIAQAACTDYANYLAGNPCAYMWQEWQEGQEWQEEG